jgi:hypothetical protein
VIEDIAESKAEPDSPSKIIQSTSDNPQTEAALRRGRNFYGVSYYTTSRVLPDDFKTDGSSPGSSSNNPGSYTRDN